MKGANVYLRVYFASNAIWGDDCGNGRGDHNLLHRRGILFDCLKDTCRTNQG